MEFADLRYGMFVHFGVFSTLARGEWVMNREAITPDEMRKIAARFNPEKFNADEICQLAVDGGMKYIVFTTMHHEGFRMYNTALSDYNIYKNTGRDLVREVVDAARKHGLKIGLYHSLNNWFDQPDAVAALENKDSYDLFIRNTFARLEELFNIFAPVDICWYDGWWPFNSDQWQAEKMNAALKNIQSDLLFNGRNGLPGDFGTPEQHLTAPSPWRPWEACVTLNNHWGYYENDNCWKSPQDVINMLLTCGSGRGNLLLNIGPRGDGTVPEESVKIIRAVGQWLREGGAEAIANCEKFSFSPMIPQPDDRGDWDPHGRITVSGNNMYYTLMYPRSSMTVSGLQMNVKRISSYGLPDLDFTQNGGKITVTLPEELSRRLCPVLKFECDAPPAIYRTGGMRVPQCRHPRYDPVLPDIQY